MKTTSLLIALLILPFIVEHDVFAEEFEINGIVKIIRPENAPARTPSPREVRFAYRNGQWHFAERVQGSNGQSLHQLWDDGRYMYGITSMYIDPSKPVPGLSKIPGLESVRISKSPSTPAITNNTQIYPSGFPSELSDPESAMLFYGYASSAYLDSSTNGVLDPIKFVPTDIGHGTRRVKANVIRHFDSLRLPTSICFFDSFSLTKTTAVFSASNFTNVGSIHIPLNVEVVRYSDAGNRWLETYQFEVRDLKAKCSLDSFTPEAPHRARFQDYRSGTRYARSFDYDNVVTNRWPTEDETRKRMEN